MAAPVLVPCLVVLRSEFNVRYPYRLKGADGWIGDAAHQAETSDHNDDEVGRVPIHDVDHVHEVHAIDVDNRLDGTLKIDQPGDPMEMEVQHILSRCRLGLEPRLRYVIYNRRIWEASNNWRHRIYTGPSAHREHAHFSSSYDTPLEASTAPWGVARAAQTTKDDDMALSESDIDKVADAVWAKMFDRVGPQAGQGKQVSAGALLQFSEQNLKDARDTILKALGLHPGAGA